MMYHGVAIFIAAILFFIPFFWLPSGFVDLGGDAGRLYFLDPYSIFKNLYLNQIPEGFGSHLYGMLPYIFVWSVMKLFIPSPTYLIAVEHGIKLSLGFLSVYFLTQELLNYYKKGKKFSLRIVGIVSGIVYVGFVTKTGWINALETHNQIFLNPLIFYLLLRFIITERFRYAFAIFFITFLQSQNFSFSASPQLFSFYPLGLLFLYGYCKFVIKKIIPWRKLAMIGVIFVMLHGFHLVPILGTIFDSGGKLNTYIFSEEVRQNAGLAYFDHNRQSLGKLSTILFQPEKFVSGSIFIFFIPLITFLGFIFARSRFLLLTSIFFAITFFFVSANVTLLGVRLYRQLFLIPGFMMFRSFDEKWHYVCIFFYTIFFSISLYTLSRRKILFLFLSGIVFFGVMYRIFPFLLGDFYKKAFHTQSDVPIVFDLDSSIVDVLEKTKMLSDNGNVLTLPLTLPYFQVVFGKTSGAYIGISMVREIAGKKDFPGFWEFGEMKNDLLHALKNEDIHKILQIFSLHNIRYIFRNADERILENFPKAPYYKHDITIDIPLINTQQSYNHLLSSFPLQKMYQRDVFEIYEFPDSIVRPRLYVANVVFDSKEKVFEHPSFRSAFLSPVDCEKYSVCNTVDTDVPIVSLTKITPYEYKYSLNLRELHNPFILILQLNYHKTWNLYINGKIRQPILVNGYANGWIIDPKEKNLQGEIRGTIRLGFQRYFVIGRFFSGIGMFTVFIFFAKSLWLKEF